MSNALISPPEMQLKLKKEIAENTGELEYEDFMKVLQKSVRKKKICEKTTQSLIRKGF